MNTAPDVSVVVPVYRNAASLPELAERVRHTLIDVTRYELLLVDDACPAGSGAVIDDLAHADDAVVPVHLPVNGGQQRAVLAGLAAARGRWCAVMDADLQDRPEDLRLLLLRARVGDVDVVFGGRRGRYESPWRSLTGRLHRRVRSILLPLPQDAGLFLVLTRTAADRVLALRGPSPSVVAMIGCAELRAASVEVTRQTRSSSRSSYSEGMRIRAALASLTWGLHYQKNRVARLAGRARHGQAWETR